ncbi:RNA-binding protein [Vibrio brasiliensis]|uniref:RNA-binding protein n=1 Tax=Vibrio brasiliensis LMG 20546 TaxID=945543 RepID=E8M092_9VIBR|nr:RNA-binding protein [Vibrio brasiliensis]EGA63623.1 RNA-binding protein [Vibrio brasiliensis LMG 20546]MCG9651167.1 RNA-binding protein [Vibrio brasiliensis]MCG9728151.1 RNA-binding protein [Vibrio brasiliensis]MCG9751101.1 RNA-binding protein [Vibrio brasiliensis]MCG9784926.1 RNA-binding protein [Vibrio brasiliensis]
MSSNKSTLMIVALAVLGGIIFSQVAISPALSFVLGVFASAFILKLSNTNIEQDQSNDPSTKTLYVGNLPYKANESHVKELFAKHGEVFAVRLMKDKRTGKRRGFGFVVMAAADAEPAIEALNEKDYMQRTLKVRIANDPKSQSDSTEQG